MKILAISGSLRSVSVNTAILKALEKLVSDTAGFTYFTGLADLPYFNPDDDKPGTPVHPAVANWRNQLKQADAVIICTPEYALGVPGVLKNALDWIVSTGEFVDKPVAVISASPMPDGGDKANASLAGTLGMMDARIPEQAILSIGFIKTKLDAGNHLTDELTLFELQKVLNALLQTAKG